MINRRATTRHRGGGLGEPERVLDIPCRSTRDRVTFFNCSPRPGLRTRRPTIIVLWNQPQIKNREFQISSNWFTRKNDKKIKKKVITNGKRLAHTVRRALRRYFHENQFEDRDWIQIQSSRGISYFRRLFFLKVIRRWCGPFSLRARGHITYSSLHECTVVPYGSRVRGRIIINRAGGRPLLLLYRSIPPASSAGISIEND